MASKKLEFIKLLLIEADEFLMKGDAVQSSEKLYKAAEECIKALSEIFNLEEVKAAEEKGRWTVTLLEKAVRKLTNKLGIEVQLGWDAANHLHIWGFHEAKLDKEDVEGRKSIIKRLIELLEKHLLMNETTANPKKIVEDFRRLGAPLKGWLIPLFSQL
ncbi:MAG: PaREP1 family protein [Candidatus Bathyarchaeia archaeon]|nr:PaREP1 family protein [Candidatus Bathyarchaeota archaeon]